MEPRAQFAANLRTERQRKNLTQEALGHLCNLHPTEISLLERAGRDPRLDTLIKLAHGLNIAPTRLLRGIS